MADNLSGLAPKVKRVADLASEDWRAQRQRQTDARSAGQKIFCEFRPLTPSEAFAIIGRKPLYKAVRRQHHRPCPNGATKNRLNLDGMATVGNGPGGTPFHSSYQRGAAVLGAELAWRRVCRAAVKTSYPYEWRRDSKWISTT